MLAQVEERFIYVIDIKKGNRLKSGGFEVKDVNNITFDELDQLLKHRNGLKVIYDLHNWKNIEGEPLVAETASRSFLKVGDRLKGINNNQEYIISEMWNCEVSAVSLTTGFSHNTPGRVKDITHITKLEIKHILNYAWGDWEIINVVDVDKALLQRKLQQVPFDVNL